MQAGKSARDSKRKTDLEAIKAALVLYRVNNGSYPPKDLTSTGYPAVLQNYISGGNVPNDPKDNSVYSYDPKLHLEVDLKHHFECHPRKWCRSTN